MYEQYFGFTRTPFRLESEPDMFFFGESQKNVLDCIKKSLSLRKGLITLSGLPGSGKTTVMRRAIEESIVPDTIICRINRAKCHNFHETLKREIRARQKNSKTLQSADLHQLVANAVDEKKHFLVVIDESQQLTETEVDELFSLVSIEKDSRKHFKFLLVSHEPFHEYFDISKYANSDELLSTHCFLLPLLHEEILPYIEHRLSNTGWKDSPSFSRNIEYLVFLITQGIPRRINSFFDRLMLFSYFENNKVINEEFIKNFCRDLLSELDEQSHPDLDSFDLRQALRRERRLFSEYSDADQVSSQVSNSENEQLESLTANKNTDDKSGIVEPLASEDPEKLVSFVSSFIKNPERYKNYTDQYYKIPKNLTLLLCLATETDQYIDDVTPLDLSSYSATEIKDMIAVFIEKMLITSRFDPHRILGLDSSASEDEINRHFSYMMRLCRSDYVKSNRSEFESVIKEAYIKLLSANKISEDEIPVVDDVLISAKDEADDAEELKYREGADKKIAELENAKRMLNEVSAAKINATVTAPTTTTPAILPPATAAPYIVPPEEIQGVYDKKKNLTLPISIVGLAVAAGMGYFFLGLSTLPTPETQPFQAQTVVSAKSHTSHETREKQEKTEGKERHKDEYPQITLLKKEDLSKNLSQDISKPKPTQKSLDEKKTTKLTNTKTETKTTKTTKETKLSNATKQSSVAEPTKKQNKAQEKAIKASPKKKASPVKTNIAANVAAKKVEQVKTKPPKVESDQIELAKVDEGAKKSIKKSDEKSDEKSTTVKLDTEQSAAAQSATQLAKEPRTLDRSKTVPEKIVTKTKSSSKPVVDIIKKPLLNVAAATTSPVAELLTDNNLLDNVVAQDQADSAKKTAQEIQRNEKSFLDRMQLDRVISNYKYTYENGDIDELTTLFAENAVTNEGFNRDQIVEDYELLFDESDKRSIEFGDIAWDQKGDVAIGSGRFTLSVIGKDNMEKHGKISIKVIKKDETVQIKQLFFLYQLAEIE